ncbi:hypothetical protein [Comamonas aquatica]|uniref:hypothetical protein n=1 Tax=Comamonas aquatica TaxID=225991 RepID=UPI00244CEFF0|nr:hypothetical protein [Comamonas aquatica]MDH1814062.1 hypothetical protein [Comamonas aquatica]
MTKHLDLALDKYQAQLFSSPIRGKSDVITVWMNTVKAFLVQQPAIGSDVAASLSIFVSTMSRLFCVTGDGRKIYSISFPFTVRTDGAEIRFFSRAGIAIDSQMSSLVLTLVNTDGVLEATDPYLFIDPVLTAMDINHGAWLLLRELILAEDGYVRYDWDTARVNGHLHPEHHLDLCYSNASTFKVGLPRQLTRGDFQTILDITADCHYLHPSV